MSRGVTSEMDGLAAFRVQLQQLPAELVAEASARVNETLARVASQARSRYPRRTYPSSWRYRDAGQRKLADSVEVQPSAPGAQLGDVIGRVRVRAPHAHLYEGEYKKAGAPTQRATKGGGRFQVYAAGANRGTMPATPVVRAIAPVERALLRADLIAMVRAAGFRVEGM